MNVFGTGIFTVVLYLQCLLHSNASTCKSIFSQQSCSLVTSSGRLNGDCSNVKVDKYLGIPYAEPPVGNLRFSNPKAYKATDVTAHSATTLPPFCAQLGIESSEDCLYLNVWTPKENSLKPVMVWVHGGSNVQGGTADPIFDGTTLAQNEDVVVVSFNYRLGILGFYDDGTNTNFAIKDAILALNWVQANIKVFGGDPKRVTLFGNSSGGSIIRAILAAPVTKGLVNNVIFQSDPQNFGFDRRSVSSGYLGARTRQLLNCHSISCMRQQSLQDIASVEYNLILEASVSSNLAVNKAYPFGPVLDGEILFKDYSAALLDGTLPNKVDTITGFVQYEAGPTIATLLPSPSTYPYSSIMASELGSADASAVIKSDPAFTSLLNDPSGDGIRKQLVYSVSTLFWQCPIQYNAQLVSKSNNAWVYSMSKGIQHPSNVNISLCQNGHTCHQDDLYVTFGTDPNAVGASMQTEIRQMQARWAAFARTGRPNAPGLPDWPRVSTPNTNVLELSTNKIQPNYNGKVCINLQKVASYSFQKYSV